VAGGNRVAARDTNLFVTATNCSGARVIGCETSVSSSYLDLRASVVSASADVLTISYSTVAEISQTDPSSQIILSYTRLQNLGANSYPFTPAQIPSGVLFGVYSNQEFDHRDNGTYYLLPGTTLRTNLITNISFATPYFIQQDCLMRGLFFSANTTITSGSVKALIYHNGITGANVIPIATTELNSSTSNVVSNLVFSYKFHRGDVMYVNLSMGLSGGNNGQPGLYSFQLNVGLF
jgi:hypothetical protein